MLCLIEASFFIYINDIILIINMFIFPLHCLFYDSNKIVVSTYKKSKLLMNRIIQTKKGITLI